ncbi:hypothetical protein M422DRAFT_99225, partial [Sphaerobolus stellatus SS14]
DGHQSHETPEMHRLAFDNEIILFSIPPHCTHMLQPLDVGVFGPFQRAWTENCIDASIDCDPVTRYNFAKRYMKIREISVTPKIIQSAFERSGLWPINPD